MNLHEYQAKELLSQFSVDIQTGTPCVTVKEAEEAYTAIKESTGSSFAVIKAQIHAGGRGKGSIKTKNQRGVELAKSMEDVTKIADNLLGGTLVTVQTGKKGKKVHQILVAEDVYYKGASDPCEYYFSIMADRLKEKNVIVYSTEGGVDIEEVADRTPEKIFKLWVDPSLGLQGYQARKVCFDLQLSGEAFKKGVEFVDKMYKAFVSTDASLIEVNPTLKTSDERVIAVDCKMQIDDSALWRQKAIANLQDKREDDPTEIEAASHHLNYVKLEGNVGCMVNGAGLAMATMDMIKLSGGEPANFLDVGGGASAQTVESGFRIILKDPHVKAILVNIFGGIVRCDRVANGIIEAYNKLGEINVPIIVRLQGTRAEEAKKIIRASGLNVQSAVRLHEAAELVNKSLQSTTT